MTLEKITRNLLLLSLGVFLFGFGYRFGQFQTANPPASKTISPNSKNLDFKLFWESWDRLTQKFVDKSKLDTQKMFYGAIRGMVASLDDPYTFFLTPEENKQSKDDLGGKFEGIGAELGLEGGTILVVAPLKNSPAQKAGIVAGDIILEVDGVPVQNWTLQRAVSAIRGEKGTTVALKILRGDKDIKISIVRDTIKIDSVELEFEKGIAILKLNRFGDNTNQEWDNAVDRISAQYLERRIKALVLDIRDNPGGYLIGAVYVASEFLPQGKLVVVQEHTDGTRERYEVDRRGQLTDIPLVVIINKGSASASEIVAGALKDHRRAKIVGQQSFGKGSVQEALDLSDGAGLHVTVAKWVLPNGDWINHAGITPEIEIKNEIPEGSTLTRQIDSQLDKAIETVLKLKTL